MVIILKHTKQHPTDWDSKMALPLVCFNMLCPGGGMEYTVVLEASAERIESSSLSLGTKHGSVGKLVTPGDCKSSASGTVGSSPTVSTKLRTRSLTRKRRHPLQKVNQLQVM